MEKTFLTKEELDQLKEIQEKNKSLVSAFGEIEISIQTLNNQKQNLINSFNELKETEKILADTLQKKYGNGSIDIETGEFIKLS